MPRLGRTGKTTRAAYVIPHIGAERLQRLNEPQLLQLYGKLLSEGRVKRDQQQRRCTHTGRTRSQRAKTPLPVRFPPHVTRRFMRRAPQFGVTGPVSPLKQTSPGLAPKTVRNIHALIHRALVDAVAWKYIADNPASNVKPPKRPRTRREVWNPDQIRAFLTSVRHDRFAALFLLELTTGIRRGQVCGLKWTSVDLDAGEITVHDNRVVVAGHARYKAGGKTKNADQTIALDQETVAALRTWREQPRPGARRSSAPTTTPVTTCSRSRMAAHHTRTPSGSVSTASRQRQDSRGSRSTICGTPTPPVRSKPESARRWSATASAMRMLASSCRPTRTCLGNDDRTPPSRPPHSFSGTGGIPNQMISRALMFPNPFPSGMKTAPGEFSGGRFTW